jgi:hypothetical protein
VFDHPVRHLDNLGLDHQEHHLDHLVPRVLRELLPEL